MKLWSDIDLVVSRSRDALRDALDYFSTTEFAQIYRKVRPYSMCGNVRLRALYRAVRHVVEREILGDVVECGSAAGGSAFLMALTLKRLGSTRAVWMFDTFDGLPAPTRDDPDWETANRYTGSCRATLDEVTELAERLGIRDHCRFVKGRFQDTLATAPIGAVSVLHIDGDWFESVKVCLVALYDRVSPGGLIQIDDYGHWKGARKAVDQFLAQRPIPSPLRRVDYTGRQLVKPPA